MSELPVQDKEITTKNRNIFDSNNVFIKIKEFDKEKCVEYLKKNQIDLNDKKVSGGLTRYIIGNLVRKTGGEFLEDLRYICERPN